MVSITIPSPVFATYHGFISKSYQYGLIYGLRKSDTEFFITQTICLSSSFINSDMSLKTDIIAKNTQIIQNSTPKACLLGWFTSQRNRVASLSLVESVVHSQLEKFVNKPCIFSLFSSKIVDVSNRWVSTFFYPSVPLLPIKLNIVNLKLSGQQDFATPKTQLIPPGLFTGASNYDSVHNWLDANYRNCSSSLQTTLVEFFKLANDPQKS